MAQHDASRAEDRRAERGLPIRAVAVDRDLADDELEHAVEEIVLVANVRVQRHRLDPELGAEAAHADGLDALPVRQANGSLQHALARERERRVDCFTGLVMAMGRAPSPV